MTASTEPLGFQLIEIMGHRRAAGFVEPRVFGGAVLLHVTMPAGEPEERVLHEGVWIDNEYCGPGSRIRETRLAVDLHVGIPSVFRMTAATEEQALRAQPRRVEILEQVRTPLLGAVRAVDPHDAEFEDDGEPDFDGPTFGDEVAR
jgi:hypothetical protein